MKFKIIIICSLLMLFGCSLINGPSKPTPNLFENFSYPLEVGNKWMYEITGTASNIRPDTVQFPFPLVRKASSVIEVVDLNDSLEYYILNSTVIDSMNPEIAFTGSLFLNNEDNGLYIYASNGYDSPLLNFDDEAYKLASLNRSTSSAHDDEIKSLQYPIAIGERWITSDTLGNPYNLEKVITRFEKLETTIGTFDCFVVEWIMSVDNITIIDYYSKIGLMKRIVTTTDMRIYTYESMEIARADITEEYVLVEFTQGQ